MGGDPGSPRPARMPTRRSGAIRQAGAWAYGRPRARTMVSSTRSSGSSDRASRTARVVAAPRDRRILSTAPPTPPPEPGGRSPPWLSRSSPLRRYFESGGVPSGAGPRNALQAPLLEPAAQDLLVELAHARLGHLLDERERVRDPPLCDPVLQVVAQLIGGEGRALLHDDAGERPLLPAVVRLRYDRRLDHVRVGHDLDLELHRGDPLAAGLDHVLGAV